MPLAGHAEPHGTIKNLGVTHDENIEKLSRYPVLDLTTLDKIKPPEFCCAVL